MNSNTLTTTCMLTGMEDNKYLLLGSALLATMSLVVVSQLTMKALEKENNNFK